MKIRLVLMAALIAISVSLAGCKEEGPMEKAGKSIDSAAEDAKDAVEEAAEEVKDEVDDATSGS